ncbi:MAG: hypothetical protein AAF617_01300 [Bacteroidota bacterium]
MKKKSLKSLLLKKASISKLNGGATEPSPITLTIDENCLLTLDLRDCPWYSELFSACWCEPSWHYDCQQSADIICEP